MNQLLVVDVNGRPISMHDAILLDCLTKWNVQHDSQNCIFMIHFLRMLDSVPIYSMD